MGKNSTRWPWTDADRKRLCDEVWGCGLLLDWNTKTGRTHGVFWDQIAGRLWPDIQTTGDGCRKQWEVSKDAYFLAMKADFEAEQQAKAEQESIAEDLKKYDDEWERLEGIVQAEEWDYNERMEATMQDISARLAAIEENQRRLCEAWDVPAVEPVYKSKAGNASNGDVTR